MSLVLGDELPGTEMYNILYLNPVSLVSGAEMSLLLLLRHLDRQSFRPVVALPAPGRLSQRLEPLGVEAVVTPLNKINTRNPLPYLQTVFHLARLIHRHRINLVHCNADICHQYALPAARLNRVPIVCHTRNLLGKRSFRRMFLGYADVLIANSQAVAQSYATFIRKSQKVVVVYNGVDLAEFSPRGERARQRQRLGIDADTFAIGAIGRIDPSKGQDVFLEALAQVAAAHPRVCALIVGDTRIDHSQWFLEQLHRQAEALGLAQRVVFTGFVEDTVPLYEALDLLVLPSLAEPFGRTLIEAMALGKPVVATRAGGVPEVVKEGETGFLVPPGEATPLAEAIGRLVEDRALAQRMGEGGRRRAAAMFSAEKTARETESIYREVLVYPQTHTQRRPPQVGKGP